MHQALAAVALNGVIKLEGPVESATKSFLVSLFPLSVSTYSLCCCTSSSLANSINTVSVLAFGNVEKTLEDTQQGMRITS